MGRVSLRRVTVFNFRSFLGQHSVSFEDNGLYLVRGVNFDRRGESGAGKSSLLLAIAYGLDFAPYSVKDLSNWDDPDNPMWVELEFETDQGTVVLHRGDKLWLKVGKNKPTTSAKAVDEKLTEILKVPTKLREAVTYRRQRQPGMFLSKRDSEKKAFLVELLGLQWLEKEIDKQVKVVTKANQDVMVIEPALAIRQQELLDIQKSATELVLKDLTPFHTEVELLAGLISTVKGHLRELSEERKKVQSQDDDSYEERDRLKALFTECVKREVRAKAAEDAEREKWDTVTRGIESRLVTCSRALGAVPGMQANAQHLEKQIAVLQQSKCSECLRTWTDSAMKLEEKELELEKLNKEIARFEATREEVPKLKAMLAERGSFKSDGKLDKMREMRSQVERELAAEELRLEQTKTQRVAHVQAKIDAKMNLLHKHNEALAKAQSEIVVGEMTNDLAKKQHQHQEERIQMARKARNDELVKLNEAKKVLSEEQDYLEMLRGFMSKYFADILQQIADEANKIIGNLPNTSNVTLHFDVERETQNGKLKDEITPVVFFGDKEWSLEAGASGGMFTSIELAVDLAVGRIIADRTGCDIGWLILDESFNGHDKTTKESCLQILQQYAADKLIIIVDHASEFKEMFTKVIDVTLDKGRSTLEVS